MMKGREDSVHGKSHDSRVYRNIRRRKGRLEKLLFKFGRARRRAYALKRKGYTKSEIEKILQDEICLNSRYIKDAYHSVKDLPPHVTFGGLNNQRASYHASLRSILI